MTRSLISFFYLQLAGGIILLLIYHRTEINVFGDQEMDLSRTDLMEQAKIGKIDDIRLLFNSSKIEINVNSRDKNGFTALMEASGGFA